MGGPHLRYMIASVLVISLAANFCMLIRTQNFYDVAVFQNDQERIRWEARQMVSKIIEGFDILSLESAKALIFDSLLTCMFDHLKSSEQGAAYRGIFQANNFSLLSNIDSETLQTLNARLEKEVHVKGSVIAFLSQPILDTYVASYTHNPRNACAAGATEVLVVVPSAPGNFENRVKVRKGGRGEYVGNPENKARLLFFVGNPANNQSVQAKLDEESKQYGDIVQENFDDVYKNIRLKAMSMLRWAITFCARAKYVIRTDDDVRVDMTTLVSVLRRKRELYENFIVGDRKDNWEAVRNNNSKYYLSPEDYPSPTLPPFALGGLLGYPMSSVSLLYQAALRTRPIWLDDVFITGICAPKVNVPLLRDKDFVFKHRAW
ncbi:unnamed protein product [Lymnaea stagnalis]|uniref:Hexosyltransferase n=1 Tax=Lymnaea stagnalis TaxID=6523 RepID=A0AAV2HYD9_LYMST